MGIEKNPSYLIEVYYTKDEFDLQAKSLKENLRFTKLKNINIKTSSLYHISGKITLQQVKEISQKLLIDPLIQNFLIRNRKYEKKPKQHYVEVWYKNGITDVTADSIIKVIKDLGIKSNLKIKTGRKYLFSGKIKKTQLEKIIHKFLINELIHQYKVVSN